MHFPIEALPQALLATVLFGVVAIALLFLGYKVFDWATPKLDLEAELIKNNLSVAIVLAALILGLSWIIVTAMS